MLSQILALLLSLAVFAFLAGWAIFIDYLQRWRRQRESAQRRTDVAVTVLTQSEKRARLGSNRHYSR
jgi:threonine/homoserine/homoserine lactone efflux protein